MNAPLRHCPTCGHDASDIDIGLRDYRWLGDALPGKIAPMDVDFMLERNGHFLVLELKPAKAPLPMGQRLTLKALTRGPKSVQTWLVRDAGKKIVEAFTLQRSGYEGPQRH